MASSSDPHLVAIVDGNQNHRQQLTDTLVSHYTVNSYGDSTNALMGVSLSGAGLVMVGEHVPPSRGINFIKAMRNERTLASTPVIFMSDTGDRESLQAALNAGANGFLLKPYRRSTLLRAISDRLDARVALRWQALTPMHREALEGTLGVFNGIADIMESGGAIQYWAVAESCAALVDAVNADSLGTLFNAVEEHNNWTYAHALRVAALLTLFGQALGLPKNQRLLLASGGLLHDIGKLSIPHSLLYKRDPLTPEETEIIQGHVPASIQILKTASDLPVGVLIIAGQHHERLDGSGYPAGLKAPQLNDLARIAAIADVFADMTTSHAYRRPMQAEAALKTMAEEMGEQLDQTLVRKFRDLVLDSLPLKHTHRLSPLTRG